MSGLFGDLCEGKRTPLPKPLVIPPEYEMPTEYERVEITWKEGEVVAGHTTFTGFNPILLKSFSEHPWEVGICKVLGLPHHGVLKIYPFQRDRYNFYSRKLGCRPTVFVRAVYKFLCMAFIQEGLRDVADKFCRVFRGRYEPLRIQQLWSNRVAISQLKEDGMENIIPIALRLHTFTVRDFRKAVGKSAWKQYLRNSIHRNTLLAGILHPLAIQSPRLKGGLWLSTPSTLLRYPFLYHPSISPENPSTVILTKIAKEGRFMRDMDKVLELFNIIQDSLRMYRGLPVAVAPKPRKQSKWGFEEWEAWHEELIELTNASKYSKDKIAWLSYYHTEDSSCNKFTSTILNSKYDVKQEGVAMRHCVAGYGDSVVRGNYMVISIQDSNGKRFSTLGLTFKRGAFVSFSQHYMACNKRVLDEDCKAYERKLIRLLSIIYEENKEKIDEEFH